MFADKKYLSKETESNGYSQKINLLENSNIINKINSLTKSANNFFSASFNEKKNPFKKSIISKDRASLNISKSFRKTFTDIDNSQVSEIYEIFNKKDKLLNMDNSRSVKNNIDFDNLKLQIDFINVDSISPRASTRSKVIII